MRKHLVHLFSASTLGCLAVRHAIPFILGRMCRAILPTSSVGHQCTLPPCSNRKSRTAGARGHSERFSKREARVSPRSWFCESDGNGRYAPRNSSDGWMVGRENGELSLRWRGNGVICYVTLR